MTDLMNKEELTFVFKDSPNFILYIWTNGKTSSNAFTLLISNPSKYTYKTLKLEICRFRHWHHEMIERIILYNNHGIEIDDTDVSALNYGDILYLAPNGEKFSEKNYEYEYETIKYIKKGGFGEIYLVKHFLTNKYYAIKKTNLKKFASNHLYNISREAFLLQTLKHKNILEIYNSYSTNDFLFIIMEYAKGGELFSVIKKNGLTEKECKFYFKQIYSAIQYIHSKNIIHRDLKPNNILFLDEKKTHLVVIDFGISGVSNGNNHDIIKAGTTKYMSPEMFDKECFESSTKIDIWSLGIILYLLFYGKFPFEGKNNEETILQIIKNPLIIPENKKISETMFQLLINLLNKNPTKRIDTNSELFSNWFDDESMILHSFLKPKRLSLFNRILNCSNNDLTPKNLICKENSFLEKNRKNGSIKNNVKNNKKENNLILPPITVGNAYSSNKNIKRKKTFNKRKINILYGE